MDNKGYWFAVRPSDTAHGHPVLVFDLQNRLHFHLTIFAKAALTRVAKTTARVYLYAILPFFTFLDEDEWQVRAGHGWDSPPVQVRQAVQDYLVHRQHCKIVPHRMGFQMVYPAEESTAALRIFIAGLKLFYAVMRQQDYYSYENPLIDHVSSTIAQLAASIENPSSMPESSGVVEPRRHKRLTDSYFKLEHQDWVPQIIDDPSLPQQILEAGRRYGWGLREECITRILFESGARISEVLSLRLEDWLKQNALQEANALSKGSRGRRVKIIRFTSETAKLLRYYVDTERRDLDSSKRTVEQYLKLLRNNLKELLTAPLFLSQRRSQLSDKTFRDRYWNPACQAAGLEINVHQARHWYVTQMVRYIYENAKDAGDVERGLHSLIVYMKWKSGQETLKAYDHYFEIERHTEIQGALHAQMYETIQISHGQISTIPSTFSEDSAFDFLREIGGNSREP